MSLVRRVLVARRLAGSAPVAVLLLIGANLIPLAGVLFFGWDLMTILVAYWLENGIVGLFNVARMATAANGQGRAVMIPFFGVHYGIFWAVHGVFVFALPTIVGDGAEAPTPAYLAIGAISLLVSHAVSFVANYLGRAEYRTASVDRLMMAPYGRVVVLHLTVLLGGTALLGAGGPVGLVALLVLLKTGLDLLFHLREHRVRRALDTAPYAADPG